MEICLKGNEEKCFCEIETGIVGQREKRKENTNPIEGKSVCFYLSLFFIPFILSV